MSTNAFRSWQSVETEPVAGARRFCGRVALVTGASDYGIGGAVAERLASEGAAVSLFSLESPAALLDRLDAASAEVVCVQGDVSHTEAVSECIDATMDRFGKIDLVVNAAGVEIAGDFQDLADDQWQRLLDTNLTGVIRMTRAALPYLPQPGGVIVNIASVLGVSGCAGLVAYSATKGGVVALTRSLALELAPKRIRVVAVAPAVVHTPMVSRYADVLTPKSLAQIRTIHPFGLGQPQDVAAAIAFLASDEAHWVSGVVLPMGWVPSLQIPLDERDD